MKTQWLVLTLALVAITLVGCKKEEASNTPQQPPAPAQSDGTPSAAPISPDTPATAENAYPQPPAIPAKLGDPAPGVLDVTWVKNGPVIMKKGTIYVVEFWATWCPPCRASIPHLTELQKTYAGKVVIIGISDEKPETVNPFVEQMGDKMDYAVALDTGGKMREYYTKPFNAQYIPHAFIVDTQGIIVWQGNPLQGMDTPLERVVAGTFDAAGWQKEQQEREARLAQIETDIAGYFNLAGQAENRTAAQEIGRRLIASADAASLNSYAWKILTEVEAAQRDLPLALQAATRANELTKGQEPAILDTYALALFQNGKVDEAIITQKAAVELSKTNPAMQKGLQQTLDKYLATKK